MKDIIKAILYEWKERKLPQIIQRDTKLSSYLNIAPKKITVVSGFRRVGKTYLTLELVKDLLKDLSKEEVIYINFEDERIPERTNFLTLLLPTIKQTSKKDLKFLFLDEIQNIPKWSKWLRRIDDTEPVRIFVSGSSSKTSSKEIPTELRGRFLEVRVFPLSFEEFLRFKEKKFDLKAAEYSEDEKAKIIKMLNEYLEFGSLPEIVLAPEEKKREIAHSYYNTVVRRDIIEKFNVKNEEALKALLRLLLNSKEYSINKLYNTLKSLNYEIGKTTLQHYLGYIENSYFMFSLPIFSYKIKDQLQYVRKNYFIDTIFITSLSTRFSKEQGRLYENKVALSLQEKYGENLYYWKDSNNEVDFVVKEGLKVKQLIQVCYSLAEENTKKREIRALLRASKELQCKDLLIVNEEEEKVEEVSWFGIERKIKFLPLWKFLLFECQEGACVPVR